jgi:hypothetical protein
MGVHRHPQLVGERGYRTDLETSGHSDQRPVPRLRLLSLRSTYGGKAFAARLRVVPFSILTREVLPREFEFSASPDSRRAQTATREGGPIADRSRIRSTGKAMYIPGNLA